MPLPRQPINLHQKVRAMLQHTAALLPEAECPIRHFERSASVGMSVIEYMLYRIDAQLTYPAVYDRHFGHLRRMVLAELLESFERFLKELAAVCVDQLAPYTLDDRFDAFAPRRTEQIAAFVTSRSIGRAL